MRPIIGITSDYKPGHKPVYHLDEAYAQAVFSAGGQPFIITPLANENNAVEVIQHIYPRLPTLRKTNTNTATMMAATPKTTHIQ